MGVNKLQVNSIPFYLSSQGQRSAMRTQRVTISQLEKVSYKSSFTSRNDSVEWKGGSWHRYSPSHVLLGLGYSYWGVKQKHAQTLGCLCDSGAENTEELRRKAGGRSLPRQAEVANGKARRRSGKERTLPWWLFHYDAMRGGRRDTRNTTDILGGTILHRPDCSMHCMLFSNPRPPPCPPQVVTHFQIPQKKTTGNDWKAEADEEAGFGHKSDCRKPPSVCSLGEKRVVQQWPEQPGGTGLWSLTPRRRLSGCVENASNWNVIKQVPHSWIPSWRR